MWGLWGRQTHSMEVCLALLTLWDPSRLCAHVHEGQRVETLLTFENIHMPICGHVGPTHTCTQTNVNTCLHLLMPV